MEKFCRNCGSAVPAGDRFCSECGTRVERMEDTVIMAEEVEVIIEPPKKQDSPAADFYDLRERLIGTKVEYYLPKFTELETTNKFASWNWAAFFFSTIWMMYRKMYVFGLAWWAAANLVSALGVPILSLLMSIGAGVLGNFLYMKDINNRVNKAMEMQPDMREAYVEKNSGSSWVGVLVLFVLSIVLSSILY